MGCIAQRDRLRATVEFQIAKLQPDMPSESRDSQLCVTVAASIRFAEPACSLSTNLIKRVQPALKACQMHICMNVGSCALASSAIDGAPADYIYIAAHTPLRPNRFARRTFWSCLPRPTTDVLRLFLLL